MMVSTSPWDGSTLWRGRWADAAAVAEAVERVAAAFPAWADTTWAARHERLQALAAACTAAGEELVDLLVREAGKHVDDARAELALLAKKIAITGAAMPTVTPSWPDGRPVGEPGIAWRPRGPVAVLGPFNYPLHLVHGLVVPALAVGCTVVVKPSEHCPAVSEAWWRCCQAAGLGEQVALVQGDGPVAQRLVRHPAISTVAAVGSHRTGQALAAALAERPEVVLALEMGGVNHALVCADAATEPSCTALAEGAWRMAGQRCTATRIVHVPRADCDAWIDRLGAERGRWCPPQATGPMINAEAARHFRSAFGARPPGLRLLAGRLDGSDAFQDPLLLQVVDPAVRAHPLLVGEQFGPALIVDPYEHEDDAVARMAAGRARLAASVFTADPAHFEAVARRLPYGQVNHNRGTAGARSDMPFGGCGLAGNGHPAALHAMRIFADACVVW